MKFKTHNPIFVVGLSLRAPKIDYSLPPVGGWKIEVDNDDGAIPFVPTETIRSSSYEWEDEGEEEVTRSLLDDLQALEDDHSGKNARVTLWSGGGANEAVFSLKLGEDHSQFHMRAYGHAVGCVGVGKLIEFRCGTNLVEALEGMRYMHSSSYHLSTEADGKLTPPSWEDIEYVGSVPALGWAKTAEEAVKIVSTLREVEEMKHKVLHEGVVGRVVLMEYDEHRKYAQSRVLFPTPEFSDLGEPEVALPEGYEDVNFTN